MSSDGADWVGLRLKNGCYRVTALLGEGGMGRVYRAHDTRLDSEVVIKVPKRELLANAQAVERFRREVQALRELAHPHIVSVLDDDEHSGLPFVVMRYLPGGNLHDRMYGPGGDSRPIPPEGLHTWLTDVAAALDYIHAAGYLHRDVKPHNILLDARGKAFVSDFGLAKAVENGGTRLTYSGQLLGTVPYTAPEVGGRRYDHRIDQYALAVTVYEWLCGRRPFDGTMMEVLIQHATQPPPPPRQWVPDLPEPTEQAILRALAKAPAQRFGDCRTFARAVLNGIAPPAPDHAPADENVLPEAPRLPPTIPMEPAREIINSVGMKLVLVRAGKFLMGSPPDEAGRSDDEYRHEVEITRPFYIGVYPVTQEEYEKVMGKNPSWLAPEAGGKGKVHGLDTRRFPVEAVSWTEAAEFCRRLSELLEEKQAGHLYRLPTEAEWEYSCREEGFSLSPFHFKEGGGLLLSSDLANFNGNYPYGGGKKGRYSARTTTVGSYPPNSLGLYDLHSNVWEWCQDWYEEDYYRSKEAIKDPAGPRSATAVSCVAAPGAITGGTAGRPTATTASSAPVAATSVSGSCCRSARGLCNCLSPLHLYFFTPAASRRAGKAGRPVLRRLPRQPVSQIDDDFTERTGPGGQRPAGSAAFQPSFSI